MRARGFQVVCGLLDSGYRSMQHQCSYGHSNKVMAFFHSNTFPQYCSFFAHRPKNVNFFTAKFCIAIIEKLVKSKTESSHSQKSKQKDKETSHLLKQQHFRFTHQSKTEKQMLLFPKMTTMENQIHSVRDGITTINTLFS